MVHLMKKKESFFNPIKKEPVVTFADVNKKKGTKTLSVVEDEGKSFADIILKYNHLKFDVRYLLE